MIFEFNVAQIIMAIPGIIVGIYAILHGNKQVGQQGKTIEQQKEALQLQSEQIKKQGESIELQRKQVEQHEEALQQSRPRLLLRVDNRFLRMFNGVAVTVIAMTEIKVPDVTVSLQNGGDTQPSEMLHTPNKQVAHSASTTWACATVLQDKWCIIGPYEKLKNSNEITVKWDNTASGEGKKVTQKWTLRVMGNANPKTAEERRDCAWEIVPNPPEIESALDE